MPRNPSIVQSLPIVSGSNPNLVSETSDSYTYGVVVRPSFIPGLTVSLDYFRLHLANARRVLTRDQILEAVWDYTFAGNASVLETYPMVRIEIHVAAPSPALAASRLVTISEALLAAGIAVERVELVSVGADSSEVVGRLVP